MNIYKASSMVTDREDALRKAFIHYYANICGKTMFIQNTKNLEKTITALICLEVFELTEPNYKISVEKKSLWHQLRSLTHKKEGNECLLSSFGD